MYPRVQEWASVSLDRPWYTFRWLKRPVSDGFTMAHLFLLEHLNDESPSPKHVASFIYLRAPAVYYAQLRENIE